MRRVQRLVIFIFSHPQILTSNCSNTQLMNVTFTTKQNIKQCYNLLRVDFHETFVDCKTCHDNLSKSVSKFSSIVKNGTGNN